MTFTDEIRSMLVGDATVSGLVSDRVYPMRRPELSDLPCVVYSLVSRGRIRDLNGSYESAVSSLVTLDCMAPRYTDAIVLAGAVRDAVARGGAIQGIFDSAETDLAEEIGEGADRATYRRVLTLEIFHDGE